MNIEECIETTDIIINEGLDIVNDNIQLILRTWKTAYEKEKEERERIGKLYYEANENCIKYEKMIKKEKEKNKELESDIQQKNFEIKCLNSDIKNMYCEEGVIAILEDNFDLSREEAIQILEE